LIKQPGKIRQCFLRAALIGFLVRFLAVSLVAPSQFIDEMLKIGRNS